MLKSQSIITVPYNFITILNIYYCCGTSNRLFTLGCL